MNQTFKIPLLALHPSQLYINERKLHRLQHLTMEQLSPLPVIRIGDAIVLTDGHTRAFYAYQYGCKEIDVYWDPDELDMNVYLTCYAWCEEAGIHSVKDFEGKVISEEDYQKLWIERCQQMI